MEYFSGSTILNLSGECSICVQSRHFKERRSFLIIAVNCVYYKRIFDSICLEKSTCGNLLTGRETNIVQGQLHPYIIVISVTNTI